MLQYYYESNPKVIESDQIRGGYQGFAFISNVKDGQVSKHQEARTKDFYFSFSLINTIPSKSQLTLLEAGVLFYFSNVWVVLVWLTWQPGEVGWRILVPLLPPLQKDRSLGGGEPSFSTESKDKHIHLLNKEELLKEVCRYHCSPML